MNIPCPAKLTLELGAIIHCLENTLGALANNDLNPIHLLGPESWCYHGDQGHYKSAHSLVGIHQCWCRGALLDEEHQPVYRHSLKQTCGDGVAESSNV